GHDFAHHSRRRPTMTHPLPAAKLGLLSLSTALLLSGAALAQPVLPEGQPESAGLSSARLAVLDAAIQAEVDAGRVAGLVLAVARRGMVVHHKAYGFADVEAQQSMDTEHLFRLYSMTKAIASVALLTLY